MTSNAPDVLFVEDDDELRAATCQSMALAGLAVHALASAEAALSSIDADFPGVVVSDVRMPGMDGLDLFDRVRALDATLPVLLVTGHADVPIALRAMKNGAFDFITKPFSADQLVQSVRRALGVRRLVLDNRLLRRAGEDGDSPLIGPSPGMAELRATIKRLALADVDVLIEGETGTGKELVAALLHRLSPRAGRPLVAVNCAAMSHERAEAEMFGHVGDRTHPRQTGSIARSAKGTLLLDEVDSMPLDLQMRLLRVLEEREVQPIGAERPVAVDLRVVAAAKPGIETLIADGRFRSDLFFRLNLVRLRLPPLRERREDVTPLFGWFLREAEDRLGHTRVTLGETERRHLMSHDWPGNVRELRSYAYRCALGPDPGPTTVTPAARPETLAERLIDTERQIIEAALDVHDGHVGAVAVTLGLPRKTLYDRMTRLGIRPEAFRPAKPKGT